jgi:hypothetical protein
MSTMAGTLAAVVLNMTAFVELRLGPSGRRRRLSLSRLHVKPKLSQFFPALPTDVFDHWPMGSPPRNTQALYSQHPGTMTQTPLSGAMSAATLAPYHFPGAAG